MSWNMQLSGNLDNLNELFLAKLKENEATFPENSENYKQAMGAMYAAMLAVDEKSVLGEDIEEFIVVLAGHANPNHANVSGMSNSTVTITVFKQS